MSSTPDQSTATSALEITLSVLKKLRYSASVDVLEHGMKSKSAAIRTACLQGLVSRGGPVEAEIVLRHIDRCGPAEIELLQSRVPMLTDAIDVGLTSKDPEVSQGALVAIAKLQISTMFHHIVRVASDSRDPQQLVAVELVLRLSKLYGNAVRIGDRSQDPKRILLLANLFSAIDKHGNHLGQQIIESWLYASHWDDETLHRVLSESPPSKASSVIVRQCERSQHKDVLLLLAALLWNKLTTNSVLAWIAKRVDPIFQAALASAYQQFGFTAQLRRNLAKEITFHCIQDEAVHEPRLTPLQRCSLVAIMTQSNRPTDEVLRHVVDLMRFDDDSIQQLLPSIILANRKLNPDVAVIALSDCMDAPDIESYEPPPWKEGLRQTLTDLIELMPSQSPEIQSAISTLLSDFSCETMMEKLDDWPRSHLIAYANLTKLSKSNFLEFLCGEVEARAFQRRLRAIQAIRIFGADGPLWDFAIQLVDDENQEVQIAAIQAIADGRDRNEAIEVLRPLMTQSNQAVVNAVNNAIESLGGF